MELKTIFIAIFVAVYCGKNSTGEKTPKFRECVSDFDFKREIDEAQNYVVFLVVTKQAGHLINNLFHKAFYHYKRIQVNLDECNGECHRTIDYLQVNEDVITSVRMMKDNVLVPNVLVVLSVEEDGKLCKKPLDEALNIAAVAKTENETRISKQIRHWFKPPRQPTFHTGPQAGPQGLPQVMPSFPQVIPAGQSAGSSMTDSQRAVWTPVFQRPVQRVDSSLPQASASGSSAQLPQGQQRVVTASFRHEPQAIVPSDWLNLTMGSSASGPSVPGSNAPKSGKESKQHTASALRPVQKIQKQPPRSHGEGKSRGPK